MSRAIAAGFTIAFTLGGALLVLQRDLGTAIGAFIAAGVWRYVWIAEDDRR